QPLSIWYATNVVGGSNFTVTVKLQSAGSLTVAIHEYAEAATSSVVDQTARANGRGTVASSGPAATTSANDLLFAATTHWDSTNTSATAGAGFTLRRSLANNTTAAALFTEDQPVTTTGTYAGTFKYAHTANYRAAVIAFRSR
ncbi:MAG TPA: hypothetical protein VKX96_12610, partial [Chloroflexota bacterium]|nr:hypothetical protein [Chloroflexota bacterium]